MNPKQPKYAYAIQPNTGSTNWLPGFVFVFVDCHHFRKIRVSRDLSGFLACATPARVPMAGSHRPVAQSSPTLRTRRDEIFCVSGMLVGGCVLVFLGCCGYFWWTVGLTTLIEQIRVRARAACRCARTCPFQPPDYWLSPLHALSAGCSKGGRHPWLHYVPGSLDGVVPAHHAGRDAAGLPLWI